MKFILFKYIIFDFDFWDSDIRFVISNFENPQVTVPKRMTAKLSKFHQKLIYLHLKFLNSNFRFVISDAKNNGVRISRPTQVVLGGHFFKDEKLKNYYMYFFFFFNFQSNFL